MGKASRVMCCPVDIDGPYSLLVVSLYQEPGGSKETHNGHNSMMLLRRTLRCNKIDETLSFLISRAKIIKFFVK